MHLPKSLIRISAAVLAAGSLFTSALAAPGTVTADGGLRLRSEASTSSSVLTMLPSGAEVDILETVDSEWYQVSYGGQVGFVSRQYVEVEGEDGPPTGFVTASSLNLRAEPSTEAEIIARLGSGVQVTLVVDENGDAEVDGEWYHVTYKDLEGYVSGQYVALEGEKYAVVTASSLNVRSAPGTDAEKVGTLAAGEQVKILEELDGWVRIDSGYISADYIALLDANTTALQAQIVAYAKTFLGLPYVYGATGPRAFDCSGLTYYVYKHFGYSINRGGTGQLRNGVTVSKSQLQPGDLVFFNSDNPSNVNRATHVGIYIGNGHFLHASSAKVGIIISDLNSSYYRSVYTTARRII